MDLRPSDCIDRAETKQSYPRARTFARARARKKNVKHTDNAKNRSTEVGRAEAIAFRFTVARASERASERNSHTRELNVKNTENRRSAPAAEIAPERFDLSERE